MRCRDKALGALEEKRAPTSRHHRDKCSTASRTAGIRSTSCASKRRRGHGTRGLRRAAGVAEAHCPPPNSTLAADLCDPLCRERWAKSTRRRGVGRRAVPRTGLWPWTAGQVPLRARTSLPLGAVPDVGWYSQPPRRAAGYEKDLCTSRCCRPRIWMTRRRRRRFPRLARQTSDAFVLPNASTWSKLIERFAQAPAPAMPALLFRSVSFIISLCFGQIRPEARAGRTSMPYGRCWRRLSAATPARRFPVWTAEPRWCNSSIPAAGPPAA